MDRRRFYLLSVALAAGQLIGQTKDPFIGTWLLDRSKSDFDPPSNFIQRTMIVEPVENGFHCIIKTLNDRQQTVEVVYAAHYDNKDIPIEGSVLDTVAVRRIDPNTIERTGKIKGKTVETATMKLSADRKVLTVTTKGSVDGQEYSSEQVFERQ